MLCFYKKDSPLSNFYVYPVNINGRVYDTMEHFFQAMKTVNDIDHEMVRTRRTSYAAKQAGNSIAIRSDWESIKENVMMYGLIYKFSAPELTTYLLNTGDMYLIEASPHDGYWGAKSSESRIYSTGTFTGLNRLGELLVHLRKLIIDNAVELPEISPVPVTTIQQQPSPGVSLISLSQEPIVVSMPTPPSNVYDVYIDGSFIERVSTYAGWAVVVAQNGNIIMESNGVTSIPAMSRNIDGEVQAAINAIAWSYTNKIPIVLYHDYIGIEKWATGVWAAKSIVANIYVEYIRDKLELVTFRHVKGHTGNPLNSRADALAKQALTG